MEVVCKNCNQKYRLSQQFYGKKINCHTCGKIIEFPPAPSNALKSKIPHESSLADQRGFKGRNKLIIALLIAMVVASIFSYLFLFDRLDKKVVIEDKEPDYQDFLGYTPQLPSFQKKVKTDTGRTKTYSLPNNSLISFITESFEDIPTAYDENHSFRRLLTSTDLKNKYVDFDVKQKIVNVGNLHLNLVYSAKKIQFKSVQIMNELEAITTKSLKKSSQKKAFVSIDKISEKITTIRVYFDRGDLGGELHLKLIDCLSQEKLDSFQNLRVPNYPPELEENRFLEDIFVKSKSVMGHYHSFKERFPQFEGFKEEEELTMAISNSHANAFRVVDYYYSHCQIKKSDTKFVSQTLLDGSQKSVELNLKNAEHCFFISSSEGETVTKWHSLEVKLPNSGWTRIMLKSCKLLYSSEKKFTKLVEDNSQKLELHSRGLSVLMVTLPSNAIAIRGVSSSHMGQGKVAISNRVNPDFEFDVPYILLHQDRDPYLVKEVLSSLIEAVYLLDYVYSYSGQTKDGKKWIKKMLNNLSKALNSPRMAHIIKNEKVPILPYLIKNHLLPLALDDRYYDSFTIQSLALALESTRNAESIDIVQVYNELRLDPRFNSRSKKSFEVASINILIREEMYKLALLMLNSGDISERYSSSSIKIIRTVKGKKAEEFIKKYKTLLQNYEN